MKTKGKILLVSLCAALLVSVGAVGTLAFFSDTDTVTNKFTVGDINLELDEAKTDLMGVEESPEVRVKENTYKLLPNHEYAKDPTVHLQKNSEDCYVFVKVVNNIAGAEHGAAENDGYDCIAEQMVNNGWVALDETKYPNVYYYDGSLANEDHYIEGDPSAQDTEFVDLVVFNNFKVRADLINDGSSTVSTPDADKLSTYDEATVVVDAYAVQADGFDTPADAWAATFGAPNQGA